MPRPLLPCQLALIALLTHCVDGRTPGPRRQPYVDEWRVVAEASNIEMLEFLSIGDRPTLDNFANRGDVEVVFDPDVTGIIVEMQRFTIAESREQANAAFAKMEYWGYNSASAEPLEPAENADALCFTSDNAGCYIRAYFDGSVQPLRDGANFRVTLPAGWNGDLEIVTSDNLGEGVDVYPDRGDVTILGLSGSARVDLDSGNVMIQLDPRIDHYAGCPLSAACEQGDADAEPPLAPFDPECGCANPTSVHVENQSGNASNVIIDVPTTSAVTEEGRWYSVWLENRADGCTATVDCEAFGPGCIIDHDGTDEKRAEINYPGEPATFGAGIVISAISRECGDVAHVDGPEDYGREVFPHERRGDLRLCSGCL